ncbi:MAG: hypothetical protein RIT27_983 [Pseudomonadota bacterium]|jgi:predicted nucleotidyltransferase
MKSLFLREKDQRCLQALMVEHLPDITVWAYGSRVTGGAHEGSDLDIVLRSKDLRPIPPTQFNRFIDAVRDSNIPILIDVHDWARLPPDFHDQILKNHVELSVTKQLV